MNERRASLFCNGRNQAVRIPREFEMEGTEVLSVVQLLASLTVRPLNEPADQHCADICVALERAGTPIGNRDRRDKGWQSCRPRRAPTSCIC